MPEEVEDEEAWERIVREERELEPVGLKQDLIGGQLHTKAGGRSE